MAIPLIAAPRAFVQGIFFSIQAFNQLEPSFGQRFLPKTLDSVSQRLSNMLEPRGPSRLAVCIRHTDATPREAYRFQTFDQHALAVRFTRTWTVWAARAREPLVRPEATERAGYVPNVVYTCGAMRHGDRIVLPYAISDTFPNFATIKIKALLESLIPG